jgi:hypothetical protein
MFHGLVSRSWNSLLIKFCLVFWNDSIRWSTAMIHKVVLLKETPTFSQIQERLVSGLRVGISTFLTMNKQIKDSSSEMKLTMLLTVPNSSPSSFVADCVCLPFCHVSQKMHVFVLMWSFCEVDIWTTRSLCDCGRNETSAFTSDHYWSPIIRETKSECEKCSVGEVLI